MEKENIATLRELKQRLQHKSLIVPQVFVGFDGFVDTIMKVVSQKHDDRNEYFKTIPEFAANIREASGRSRQFELVAEQVKLGGNAPILAHTLSRLGVSAYCAGSLGDPQIHPVFAEMDASKLISLGSPGNSSALEFMDGKIILSELSALEYYDWKTITAIRDVDRLKRTILDSALIAFVDWANLPFAGDIWEGVLHDMIKPSGRRDFNFFFDLCDPSRKTAEQIDEVLDLLGCFSAYGCVTLGLNENETLKLWCGLYGVNLNNPAHPVRTPTAEQAGDALFKMINIDHLLVHPIDRTILYSRNKTVGQRGRLVTGPKVQTGGGDNLNAGYIYGLLHSFPVEQCMLLGMATSGAYIQNGVAPDVQAICDYLDVWIGELVQVSKFDVQSSTSDVARSREDKAIGTSAALTNNSI